jgi:hypothetical protein
LRVVGRKAMADFVGIDRKSHWQPLQRMAP